MTFKLPAENGPGAGFQAPYYLPTENEIPLFEAAYHARLPVILKGPTGCGKTRFVEFMAHRLGRPLITVACHEDLFASDLIGRYLLLNDATVWMDGPLTQAVRTGPLSIWMKSSKPGKTPLW